MCIVELEHLFEQLLPERRLTGRPGPELLAAARQWSEAVWDAARTAGPLLLAEGATARGLALARRPVFICGVHRSGTTLVRDLLDGHPALSVLPSEGSFFTSLQSHVARLPRADTLSYFAQEWLRRMANPINQRPYWLLGRSTVEQSPYVAFGRTLAAWWPLAHERLQISMWPLVAVALAYAGCMGDDRVERWVEKTPTNEQFLDRLWSECPAAKVVHVVRHPLAVFASRKRLEETVIGSFAAAPGALRDLARSFRIAADRSAADPDGRYLLVRYEDVMDDVGSAARRLAAFLEIEPLPVLLEPTVARMPAVSNSSFGEKGDGSDHREVLTPGERDRVAEAVGDLACTLGYPALADRQV